MNAAAKSALPPAQDTDKVLKYENRMRKQMDWAFNLWHELQKMPREPVIVSWL